MDNRRDFLEVARVFEMYGRRDMKLDNQFIEYAAKKIYHVLTGKDDLVVHCSDENSYWRAYFQKIEDTPTITFYTKMIDLYNRRTLTVNNPNYLLNYNLKTLQVICHEVIHPFQLTDIISSELKQFYSDSYAKRMLDNKRYQENHDLFPIETHADLFGWFLVSEIVNQTEFSSYFKKNVHRNFFKKARERYTVQGAKVISPTEQFYNLVEGNCPLKVNRINLQNRLLNGLSITHAEYSELDRMVGEATHHDTPSSFFRSANSK